MLFYHLVILFLCTNPPVQGSKFKCFIDIFLQKYYLDICSAKAGKMGKFPN